VTISDCFTQRRNLKIALLGNAGINLSLGQSLFRFFVIALLLGHEIDLVVLILIKTNWERNNILILPIFTIEEHLWLKLIIFNQFRCTIRQQLLHLEVTVWDLDLEQRIVDLVSGILCDDNELRRGVVWGVEFVVYFSREDAGVDSV